MSSFIPDGSSLVARQHIQNHSDAQSEIHYWGYPSRDVPCTSGTGSCEYLDAVYWMHSVSMLYTFILWAVIGGLLLAIVISRLLRPTRRMESGTGIIARQSFPYRAWRALASASRRYLLPESMPQLLPNTTRLQILLLVTLLVYLLIFSLVGIVYKTWITPVKNSTKHNTRTGMGGFSDRVGALAYALTPLTIALSTRESILSLLTGIPYQHFNFLHRWTGRIILVQSFLHTIGWTIIEGKLYQPQPKVYHNFIKQTYMIWGIVALVFISFLFVFSLRLVIRRTGYEFFRKSHLIVAGLYLGACWGHWSRLACWMIASLGLLGIDLGLRFIRICLIHVGYKNGNRGLGFRSIHSKGEMFKDPTGTIIRLSFTHNHEPWKIGQHFYLTFPALSIWQSHPFTPASMPPTSIVPPTHTYIIRARSGETRELAALLEAGLHEKGCAFETPVILTGPYGCSVVDKEATNVLTIAGGTGISFTLPVVCAALANASQARSVEMVWIIRHVENLAWLAPELSYLKSQLASQSGFAESQEDKRTTKITTAPLKRFRMRIFVTRSAQSININTRDRQDRDGDISSVASSSSTSNHVGLQELLKPHPDFSITYLDDQHPSIANTIDTFIADTVSAGRIQVVGSGPAALGTDIRSAVAARNCAGDVWSGSEAADIDCVWDDGMG